MARGLLSEKLLSGLLLHILAVLQKHAVTLLSVLFSDYFEEVAHLLLRKRVELTVITIM